VTWSVRPRSGVRIAASVVAPQNLVRPNRDLKGGSDGSRGRPTARIMFVYASLQANIIICAKHVAPEGSPADKVLRNQRIEIGDSKRKFRFICEVPVWLLTLTNR